MSKQIQNQKIIKEKGRIILIEKELREASYWKAILEKLTLIEGMALAKAAQEVFGNEK